MLDGPDVVALFLDPEVGLGLLGHGVLCQRRQFEAGHIGILDVYGALEALANFFVARRDVRELFGRCRHDRIAREVRQLVDDGHEQTR